MKTLKIIDEIEKMRRYLPDACDTAADYLKDDQSSDMSDVIQNAADSDAEIIYYSDAVDFIHDHWEDVDEHIQEADSLFGAVRYAAYDVAMNEIHEYMADTLTLATLYHLQKNEHYTLTGAELEAIKLYMSADGKTADTFEDALNGALNTAGIINA